MFFVKKYISKKIKSPNIFENRKKILKSKNKNLIFLLEKRFKWMKNYLKGKKCIIGLGSGNGCIKKILKNKNIMLTDIIKYPWIDKKVDMIKINLGNKFKKKVDVFIINHSLHHCANPSRTLREISKFLKKDGLILINEPETSFFLKLIQIILDDESWSLKDNVFQRNRNLFSSKNPWVSNTAIAQLLFKDEKKFLYHFPNYKIEKNIVSEFLIFLNSGGVNSSFFHVKFSKIILNFIDCFDKFLIYLFPRVFAFNRTVVLRKILN